MHCFERRLAGSQVVDDEILKIPSFDLFYFSEFFEYYVDCWYFDSDLKNIKLIS